MKPVLKNQLIGIGYGLLTLLHSNSFAENFMEKVVVPNAIYYQSNEGSEEDDNRWSLAPHFSIQFIRFVNEKSIFIKSNKAADFLLDLSQYHHENKMWRFHQAINTVNLTIESDEDTEYYDKIGCLNSEGIAAFQVKYENKEGESALLTKSFVHEALLEDYELLQIITSHCPLENKAFSRYQTTDTNLVTLNKQGVLIEGDTIRYKFTQPLNRISLEEEGELVNNSFIKNSFLGLVVVKEENSFWRLLLLNKQTHRAQLLEKTLNADFSKISLAPKILDKTQGQLFAYIGPAHKDGTWSISSYRLLPTGKLATLSDIGNVFFRPGADNLTEIAWLDEKRLGYLTWENNTQLFKIVKYNSTWVEEKRHVFLYDDQNYKTTIQVQNERTKKKQENLNALLRLKKVDSVTLFKRKNGNYLAAFLGQFEIKQFLFENEQVGLVFIKEFQPNE